jgi:hypothetical protein
MDEKVLERLLIDREVGELSADASRLLEAYLEVSTEHADLAKSVPATIALARRAVGSGQVPPAETMPPLTNRVVAGRRGESLPTRLTKGAAPWPRAWPRGLAVAAAILVAFFLGSRAGPQPGPAGLTSRHITRLSTETRDAGGFWSYNRLQESRAGRPAGSIPRIKWTTPLGPPRVGEQT